MIKKGEGVWLNGVEITRTRKGYIGQQIVIDYLLRKNARGYEPIVDDFNIDLLIERDGKNISIQEKYHTTMSNGSSIQVKVNSTSADWIAIPVCVKDKIHIMWYKNTRKNKKYTIAFQMSKPKNNQVKKVNFYRYFLKSPIDY